MRGKSVSVAALVPAWLWAGAATTLATPQRSSDSSSRTGPHWDPV